MIKHVQIDVAAASSGCLLASPLANIRKPRKVILLQISRPRGHKSVFRIDTAAALILRP